MPTIFNQNKEQDKIGLLEDTSRLTRIEHISGKPSKIKFVDTFDYAGCLHCVSPHCAFYEESELYIEGQLLNFSSERNLKVCPTDAIDCSSDLPKINEELCFGCGLCASRCIVGAIFIDNDRAIVNEEKSIRIMDRSDRTLQLHSRQISTLKKVKHSGEINLDTFDFVDRVYKRIEYYKKKDFNFVNVLSRNLLIQTGNCCIIRRQGDVYIRFDALFDSNGHLGVCEIEFDKDSLESPRAILDDIAILNSRHSISKESIIPLIVNFELPNKRSEYWNVIKDISHVLGIKIQSITVGILLVCMWNNKSIDFSRNDFYIDADQYSLIQPLNHVLTHGNKLKGSQYALVEVKK